MHHDYVHESVLRVMAP